MNDLVCRSFISSFVLVTGISVAGCAVRGSPSHADAGRARRERDDGAPKAGDQAPAFTLQRLNDESKRVTLASYLGKRPVVLFFGSYT